MSKDNSQLSTIQLGISLLFKPGQMVELRVETSNKLWRGFHFNDHEKLAEAVLRLDNDPRVVNLYYVINPIRPNFPKEKGYPVNPVGQQIDDILALPKQETAKNEDIDTLNWMFIDVDTIRAKGSEHESSTNDEKAASKQVAVKVLNYLEELSWPQPLLGDSGNGYHIQCKMEFMNSTHNIHMLVDCLKALAEKFTCDAAKIDCAVFNASRLTRAYGSTTRKGTNTPERPYRRNRLIEPKGYIGVVSLDQVLVLGSGIAMKDRRGGEMPELAKGFDPEDWIEWYEKQGAFTIEGERETNGMNIKVTDTCLTAGHKHTGSGLTGFVIGETFGWHCFSDDCEGCTIGTVFQILRDAVKDDGTPKYLPYPKQVFIDEGAEAIKEALADGWIELADENDDKAEKIEEKKLDDALADRPEPEPGVELKEPVTLDGLDTVANNRATELLQIMLHHPTETWSDGFIFFIKRIKEKLGFHDTKYTKPKPGEVGVQTLSMPIGEVMRMVCKFCDKHRELPDVPTLINYIDVSPDPEVRQNQFKTEMKTWLSSLAARPATMFDDTALALIHVLDLRQEVRVWRTAFNHFLLKAENIQDGRQTLKKYWNATIGAQDTQFQQGSWQEAADDIYKEFEKNIKGENDERKCKLGFPTIDNAGGNIGLDGDRYICICGPSNNRKSTFMLSVAMNLAIQGKNVLFAAGEHSKIKVGKKLMLQLSHFYRNELGVVPSLSAWEGLNRTATDVDLVKVKELVNKLKHEGIVPGHIEAQMQEAITRGEQDKAGAIMGYAEATWPKYQWDAIFIDPVDTIMPTEDTNGRANTFQLKADVVERLFQFSRNAFGGRGCMVFISAQFGSSAVREIQRIQEKNASGTGESFDDEIESILRRDGNIHSLTTIIEKCDLCVGIATLVKNGEDGMMVRGRDREGGKEWTMYFTVDKDSNYMQERKLSYSKATEVPVKEKVMAAGAVDDEL